MSAVPRVITMLWSEKLSPKMFVDYYRKIYLGTGEFLLIKPSLYNSLEVVEAQCKSAIQAGKGCLFVMLEVPTKYEGENLPASILELSDMVVHFKMDSGGVRGGVLTLPLKLAEEHKAIIDRWSANILRLQQIQ